MQISIKLLGTLSKDADCDGNENVKPEKKFRLAKQQLCTCKFFVFVHFFGVVARLRHETDCIFSPFGDDVDERQRSSFSFPELR